MVVQAAQGFQLLNMKDQWNWNLRFMPKENIFFTFFPSSLTFFFCPFSCFLSSYFFWLLSVILLWGNIHVNVTVTVSSASPWVMFVCPADWPFFFWRLGHICLPHFEEKLKIDYRIPQRHHTHKIFLITWKQKHFLRSRLNGQWLTCPEIFSRSSETDHYLHCIPNHWPSW